MVRIGASSFYILQTQIGKYGSGPGPYHFLVRDLTARGAVPVWNRISRFPLQLYVGAPFTYYFRRHLRMKLCAWQNVLFGS